MIRILRLTGWVILGSRYAYLLLTLGDVPVSIPAAIAIFFLTAGEVAQIFNRGKTAEL